MKDVGGENLAPAGEGIREMTVSRMEMADGTVEIQVKTEEACYFKVISEFSGVPVRDEYELFHTMARLSSMESEYEKVKNALSQVRALSLIHISFRNNNRGFEDHLWEIQGLHGVEVLNGSTDMEANRKALSICKARNMQMVGASDAHWTSQLGKYATMVPGEPKDLEEFVAALHKGGLKPAIYEEGKGYRIVDTF